MSIAKSKSKVRRIRQKAATMPGTAERLFGLALCELREKKGLSLTAAAERMGIHKAHLCNIEQGSRLPGVRVTLLMADFYHAPARKLLSLLLKSQTARLAKEYAAELAAWQKTKQLDFDRS